MTYLLCLVFSISIGFSCLWLVSVINYIRATREDPAMEFQGFKVFVINSIWIAILWGLTLCMAIKTAWEFVRCVINAVR